MALMPLLLILRELNNAALYWTGEPFNGGVWTANLGAI